MILQPFVEFSPDSPYSFEMETRWLFCWDVWLEILLRNLQRHIEESPEDFFKPMFNRDSGPNKNILFDFISTGMKSCELTSQIPCNSSTFEQNASKVLRAIKTTSVALDAWGKLREESLQIQSFIQLCLCKHYSNVKPLDVAEELKLLSWNDMVLEKVSQMTHTIEDNFKKLREFVKYYYDQIFDSNSKPDLTVLVASISIERWERDGLSPTPKGYSSISLPVSSEPLFSRKAVSVWTCVLPMESVFAQASEVIRTAVEWFIGWNMFSQSVAKEMGNIYYQRSQRALKIPVIENQISLFHMLRQESQSFSTNLKHAPFTAMINILNQFDIFLEILRCVRIEMSEWIRLSESTMISLGVVDTNALPKEKNAQIVFDLKTKIVLKDRQITSSLDYIIADLDGALKFADTFFCTHPKYLQLLSPLVEKFFNKYIGVSSRSFFSPVKHDFEFEYSPSYISKTDGATKQGVKRILSFKDNVATKASTLKPKVSNSEAEFFMDYDPLGPYNKVYKSLTAPKSNFCQFSTSGRCH